jgi:hypothetical protein
MNCLLCEDHLFICEACGQPWPCSGGHGAGLPCLRCNPEGVLTADYASLERTPEREHH